MYSNYFGKEESYMYLWRTDRNKQGQTDKQG